MPLPKIVTVKIDLAASGDLVALQTSKRIRVLSYVLVSAGTVTAKFQSGGSTDLTGAMSLVAASGISSGYNPQGHFETAVGAKLNLVLSGSVQVSGHLTYSIEG